MNECRICGNQTANPTHVAREMQFGLGDGFEYFECPECGCLQITKIPEDLSRYYPTNYYSYESARPSVDFSRKGLAGIKQRIIKTRLTRHYFGRKTAFSKWLANRSSVSGEYPLWVRRQVLDLGLRRDDKILDVGCGKGKLLLDFQAFGFANLTGIDPFIETDVDYGNGVKVLSRNLAEVEGQFDFIMLNHSFEHMPDQLTTLRQLRELLKPNRYLLIRIPVAHSYNWRKYGVNWAALDAPRHLYLHHRKSMELLASQVGFKIAEVVFDAEAFTHWASEQYLAGISLMDARSYRVNPAASIFAAEDLAGFGALADELNASGEADCSAFYLQVK
jgi:SAM-dependent methyltransferase